MKKTWNIDADSPSVLRPRWPMPSKRVTAALTTRVGGVSGEPWGELNLGAHVGDLAVAVAENRRLVHATLKDWSSRGQRSRGGRLGPIAWMDQVHSSNVFEIKRPLDSNAGLELEPVATADALFTRISNQPIAVLTADCLPILIASGDGREVAAVHGGWRGLLAGVIEETVALFSNPRSALTVYIGPAICGRCYEVGGDVIAPLLKRHSIFSEAVHSSARDNKKWLLDMVCLARLILKQLGVTSIYGGDNCSYEEPCFYSYRRSGQTGRMASLIWITDE